MNSRAKVSAVRRGAAAAQERGTVGAMGAVGEMARGTGIADRGIAMGVMHAAGQAGLVAIAAVERAAISRDRLPAAASDEAAIGRTGRG